jgi:cyanophycinase
MLCLAISLAPSLARADSPAPRIDASGIRGALVICGGGSLPDSIANEFVRLAGGEKARLVVVPTASSRADEDEGKSLEKLWSSKGVAKVVALHTRSRERADDPEFVAPLREATAVWFGGGQQSRLSEVYVGTAFEKEIVALLARGGTVGGTSAGAAILSRVMIASGTDKAVMGRGLDALPDAIIDQHFLARNRKKRLLGVLAENRALVGYGIDEGTALVVQGRRLRVVGASTVTVCLAASSTRPVREIVLSHGKQADLTALRRAARARSQPAFPAAEPRVPEVLNGTLIIIGGGSTPRQASRRFVESAGGRDALIVVIPTASGPVVRSPTYGERLFRGLGCTNVVTLHSTQLETIESDEFLAPLRTAGGVWFGGGRQWRLVDAYAGTKAEELFHDVLRRGGVIGGSSAGASIQSEYMPRGHPLGNTVMMAEGYERAFGFLPGTAVDQHFAQRRRFGDMTQLVNTFPQILGIGIDESTAIIVQGHHAEVVGRHAAHFYDRRQPVVEGKPDYMTAAAGQYFDLKNRRVRVVY